MMFSLVIARFPQHISFSWIKNTRRLDDSTTTTELSCYMAWSKSLRRHLSHIVQLCVKIPNEIPKIYTLFPIKITLLTWPEYPIMDNISNFLVHFGSRFSWYQSHGGVGTRQSRGCFPKTVSPVLFSSRFGVVGTMLLLLLCGFSQWWVWTSKLVSHSHLWVWDVLAVILAPFLRFLSKIFICGSIVLFSFVGLAYPNCALFSYVGQGRPCGHFGTLFEIFFKIFHLWVNRTFFSFVGLGRPNWYLILISGFGTSMRSFWHPFWDFSHFFCG